MGAVDGPGQPLVGRAGQREQPGALELEQQPGQRVGEDVVHVAGAIGGLLLAGSLGALALAAAGTAVTPLLTSAQGANPLLTLTYLPLIIFSGGFGGLSGLPHWLNTLMSYLPAQPMIDAVTQALQPSAGWSGRDLAVLAAWALGGLLLSVRFFRWDPTRPRHARSAGAGNPARSV